MTNELTENKVEVTVQIENDDCEYIDLLARATNSPRDNIIAIIVQMWCMKSKVSVSDL